MSKYLQQCRKKYASVFTEEWQKKARSVAPDSDDERSIFYELIDFEDDCFILLSKSILSGEYISDDNFIIEIKAFISDVTIDNNNGVSALIKKYYSISDCLYNALGQYSAFFSFAYEKFITSTPEERVNLYNRKSTNEDSKISLLNYTIQICRYDYKYPLIEEALNEFLMTYLKVRDLYKEEKKESLFFIFEILYSKCNYIIKRINKKIDFSLLCESYKISPESLDISFLQELIDKQISLSPLNSINTEKLKTDIESSNPKIDSFVRLGWNMAKNKKKEDLTIIKRLISVFENKFLQNISDVYKQTSLKEQFNIFSINSVYNFLENCQFSIYLATTPFDFDYIKESIVRIDNLQRGTFINNFHPYKKSIDSIFDFIEKKIQNQDNNEITSFEKDLFAKLDLYIDKFEKFILWGEKHRFFPFQLTFEESLIEYKGLDLFIPSSFANIINYKELTDKLVEYKNRKSILANKYETYKSKLAVKKLNERIKKDRFDMLQTIIIFAGVITFLFGTINIFSNNTEMDLTQLIINTSGLGVILILFTSVFITIAPILSGIIDSGKIMKTKRFILSVILIIIYSAFIFLNYRSVQNLYKSEQAVKLNKLIMKSPENNISLSETDSLYIFSIKKDN